MRDLTHAEAEAVSDFFEGMEEGTFGKVLGPFRLAVVERDGIDFVVLATDMALRLPKEIMEGAHAGGLPIGTLEKGGFHLDLQGAVLAARHTKAQAVRVNEQASRLFLYGRNVLATSIESYDPSLERGDACIVTNPRGEALGLGVVVGSLKGTREAVRPVVDLGTYLRDQDE
jgi:ribosome biogenesis protein Nip4